MDPHRFDAFTRSFADRPNRRTVLKTAIGGLIAGIGGTFRLDPALADCEKPGGECKSDGECCSPGVCCGNACADPSAFASDPSNCGSCGNGCKSGVCVDGTCAPAGCAKGLSDCGGSCVDLSNDPNNCGKCGVACTSGVCSGSTCAPKECDNGLTDCGNGCVDLASDAKNCGKCGGVCASGTCDSGACTSIGGCGQGLTDCGSGCVNLASDSSNCGACGKSCNSGSCQNGTCSSAGCGEGTTLCSGVCVDLSQDADNCGACGSSCAGGTCTSGKCTASNCAAGLTECDGACVNLSTDSQNCGACGATCAVGDCQSGTCPGATLAPGLNCTASVKGDTADRRLTLPSGDGKLSLIVHETTDYGPGDLGQPLRSEVTITILEGTTKQLFISSITVPHGESSVDARYGPGFEGIKHSTLTVAHGQAEVRIDGRVSKPFSTVSGPPSSIEFADGKPSPNASVDPALAASVQTFPPLTESELDACFTPQASAVIGLALRTAGLAFSFSGAQSAESVETLLLQTGGAGCRTCLNTCDNTLIICGIAAGIGCFLQPELCILALGTCGATWIICDDGCTGPGAPCCPVSCPGGNCCDAGDTCFLYGCCPGGRVVCGADCCGAGLVCTHGVCCQSGNVVCAGVCCRSGQVCTNGVCCHPGDIVCGGACCGAGHTCTNGVCCPNGETGCHGRCCPAGQTCTSDGTCCGSGSTSCGGTCCESGGACVGGHCCNPPSLCGTASNPTCCVGSIDANGHSVPGQCCQGVCTGDGYDQVCVNGAPCPRARACASTCCGIGQVCDTATNTCNTCAAPMVSCLGAGLRPGVTVPSCCPRGVECCNGRCCASGQSCCAIPGSLPLGCHPTAQCPPG